MFADVITKTRLFNFDPLKPHFNIVKLGFTGVYMIFISAQNIDFGYSLEPPRRGGSNEYPQSMFWAEIWRISESLSENFHFLVVKFSVYLKRHVFLMIHSNDYIMWTIKHACCDHGVFYVPAGLDKITVSWLIGICPVCLRGRCNNWVVSGVLHVSYNLLKHHSCRLK